MHWIAMRDLFSALALVVSLAALLLSIRNARLINYAKRAELRAQVLLKLQGVRNRVSAEGRRHRLIGASIKDPGDAILAAHANTQENVRKTLEQIDGVYEEVEKHPLSRAEILYSSVFHRIAQVEGMFEALTDQVAELETKAAELIEARRVLAAKLVEAKRALLDPSKENSS